MENTDTKLDQAAISNGDQAIETPIVSEAEAPKESIATKDAILKAFEKHDPAAKPEETPAVKAEVPADADKPAATLDPVSGRTVEPMKAPASWTPVLREKWSSIDPVAQKFIRDREDMVNKTLLDTSEDRKLAKEFKDAIAPYNDILKQYGTSAMDEVKGLMHLSYQMNTATPQRRAEIIHDMIVRFQPDVQTLVALANGQRPQTGSSPAPAPINVRAEIEKIREEEAARESEKAATSAIEQFAADPENEFFHDVKVLMGKAIDAELVQGDTLPELFKNAYDLACQQHPEVKAALAARAQAAAPVSQVPAQPQPTPTRSVKPSLGNGKSAPAQVKTTSTKDAASKAFDLVMARHGM